jgi:hypothetical protein
MDHCRESDVLLVSGGGDGDGDGDGGGGGDAGKFAGGDAVGW